MADINTPQQADEGTTLATLAVLGGGAVVGLAGLFLQDPEVRKACRGVVNDSELHKVCRESAGRIGRELVQSWHRHGGPDALTILSRLFTRREEGR